MDAQALLECLTEIQSAASDFDSLPADTLKNILCDVAYWAERGLKSLATEPAPRSAAEHSPHRAVAGRVG